MKVLGVDPGTRIVGYAVVEQSRGALIPHVYGAIHADVEPTLPRRLLTIFQSLSSIVAEHKPTVVAVEKVFYGKNLQSAMRIGESRGVVFVVAANAGLEVFEYDATKIKKSVVGVGGAHKSQVQQMVKAMLGLPQPPTPPDAADALAIAICHCHHGNTAMPRL